MRIQELEHLVGMDRATIRFYEREGLIAPNRSENGYRDYTENIAEELKKIRLLRQLGMSVFTIKQLQQGSADFSETLSNQVRRLSDQIEENKRAKAVCQTMYDDGAAYDNLNAEHYLTLLREIRVDGPNKDFQENIPKEIHPWRRWLARTLDYWWLAVLVNFVIVVVMRVRPLPGDFADIVIMILCGAAFVPIEAFALSRWGTTPGKFVLGIRLESANGGYLRFDQALNRSWQVYKEGMGFRIPLISLFLQLHKYLRLTGSVWKRFARREDIRDPEEMYWDKETEITYSPVTEKRGLLLAALIAVVLTVSLFTGIDSIKPKYRSNELTIEQFAENYNHTVSVFDPQANYLSKLQPDGTKNPLREEDLYYNLETGEVGYTPNEFEYSFDNGFVKSVTIRREIENVILVSPITAEMMNLTYALSLSQPDCSYKDLRELAEMLDARIGQTEVTLFHKGMIEVYWKVEAVNCRHLGDGRYMCDDETLPSTMNVVFTVTLP